MIHFTNIIVDNFEKGLDHPFKNLYFLSHFHGDHYKGLSSYWNYGKIYCSIKTKKLL